MGRSARRRSPRDIGRGLGWCVLLGCLTLAATTVRAQSEPLADPPRPAVRLDAQAASLLPMQSPTPATDLDRIWPTAPPLRDGDGQPLPFENEISLLGFMSGAHVELLGTTSKGINRPRKVRLMGSLSGGVPQTIDAVFRAVDQVHPRHRTPDGRLLGNLRDSYRYEVAAYRVDRMLGLGRVPPAVLRRVDGRSGSLQIWIHGATDEQDRRQSDHVFRDHLSWVRQVGEHRLFDALIGNVDRNQTNLLIDLEHEWLWLIDHTRAFVADDQIAALDKIQTCPRRVYRAFQSVPTQTLEDRLADILTPREIRALVVRWRRIHEHLTQQVKRYGEGAILYGPDN